MDGGDKSGPTDNPQAGWVFKPGDDLAKPTQNQPSDSSTAQEAPQSKDSVEWTASEYVAHQKNTAWYVRLFVATAVVAALVYIVTRDTISTGATLFAGLVFAVAAARQPRVLAYRLDPGGLTIGQKYYPYSQFKSFAVMQEGPLATVVFMPLKRFVPSVDIFIPPDNAEAIMGVLSNNLPLETRKPGIVDTFANHIRF